MNGRQKLSNDKFSPGEVLQVQFVVCKSLRLERLVGVTNAVDDIAIVVWLHCWKFSVVKRTNLLLINHGEEETQDWF